MNMPGRNLLLFVAMVAMAATAVAEDEAVPVVVEDEAASAVAPVKNEPERAEAVQRGRYTDQLQLESTSVRGNQELPRLLYIVPWKDPSLGDVTGKPVNSLIEEVLAPLDRDVFLRQTSYFDQLYGTPETGVSD